MTLSTVVFDAYGTLFDVNAAARRAAADPAHPELAEQWQALSTAWRDRQLNYTWLRAVTGYHVDFWQVTKDALDWAMAAHGLDDPDLRKTLLGLYRELDAFPEATQTLTALRQAGLTTAILSNGTPEMLADATASAGLGPLLDAVLSVEEVGVFKPAAAVYDLVETRLGTPPSATLFVSSNGWDAASAQAYGFTSIWVNRTGAPREKLPSRPAAIANDLSAVPDLLAGDLAKARARKSPPHTFQTSDGLTLAYKDEGEGTPLLCLAGLTRNMTDFDFVARDFSDRARIIRLDTRGRGASAYDEDYKNYNLIREGRDALELMDHLGLERFAVLGTSRGGLLALTLAIGHRERLLGVCLNDIGPVIETEGLAEIMGYLGVVPDYATYEDAADALVAAKAREFPSVTRARWRLHAERVWKETGEGLALRYDHRLRRAVLEASATGAIPDLWPMFDALDGLPLALLRGENSNIISKATAEEMQARRPDLIFAEVPRRGHVPFLDERESQKVIGAFLDRLAA